MELTKTYRFEASHILPKHPGKCSRLHGHSWVLHVSVEGLINPETGFVMDFGDISKVVKPLVEKLDHRHLGTWEEIEGYGNLYAARSSCVEGLPKDFYPTSENLLRWIAEQIGSQLDTYKPGQAVETVSLTEIVLGVRWSKLSIEETCTSQATLTREEYDAKS